MSRLYIRRRLSPEIQICENTYSYLSKYSIFIAAVMLLQLDSTLAYKNMFLSFGHMWHSASANGLSSWFIIYFLSITMPWFSNFVLDVQNKQSFPLPPLLDASKYCCISRYPTSRTPGSWNVPSLRFSWRRCSVCSLLNHVSKQFNIGDELSTSANTCKGPVGNFYNSSSVSSETINGGMLSSHASAAIQSYNQVIAVHGQNGYWTVLVWIGV